MAISVLVVDDDTLARAGLRMMIETQDDLVVTGEAANGTDAVALAGIRTIAEGDALLSPSVTRRLMHEFARATATGGHPTDVSNRDLDRLTDREREVLVHIGHGLANREIAEELNVGESTVKTHVKRILMKLALRDRVHAVVYAYETGLLTPGSENQ